MAGSNQLSLNVSSLLAMLCLWIAVECDQNRPCPPIPSALRATKMKLYKDRQLVGHQMESVVDVSSVKRCGMLCAVSWDCMSFNYGVMSRECQLNDANEVEFDCHLVTSGQYSYYRMISRDKVMFVLF